MSSIPGPDDFPTDFCGIFNSDMGPAPARIYNTSFAAGKFPASFHHSRVVFLPNPDGDPVVPYSWRTISPLN